MKLSKRAQYGLRLLCQLALERGKGPLQMAEISRREGISEKYLGQIIISLRAAGLVESQRGFQGGYSLSRPPASIKLSDVYAALDGEVLVAEAEEGADEGSAEDSTIAATSLFWARLRGAMEAVLASHSLEDLVSLHLSKNGNADFAI
jgi:Rrf2 family protein